MLVHARVKTSSCIPAVKTPAGLNVVGGGSLAAPGGGTPAVNMKAVNTCTHIVMQGNVIAHNVTTKIQSMNCSPEVSLEPNQTRCSSVRMLQTSSGFKVQVISLRVLSTTEA